MSLAFRTVKVADIAYVTTLYFVLACVISIPLDKAFGTFNAKEEEKKSTARLMAEVLAHAWLLGAIIYLTRNVVELIPSPFEGVQGLIHSKVKELGNASVFIFFLMFYQKYLRDKLAFIQARLTA